MSVAWPGRGRKGLHVMAYAQLGLIAIIALALRGKANQFISLIMLHYKVSDVLEWGRVGCKLECMYSVRVCLSVCCVLYICVCCGLCV